MTRKTSISFPVVATIRKGGPKKKMVRSGRTIETVGPDLNDRFRVVFAPGTDDIKAKFLEVYGSLEPKRIFAIIPYTSVWDAWEFFYEAHASGRMIARADEEHFISLRDPVTGKYEISRGKPFRPFNPLEGENITYTRRGKTVSLPMKPIGRLKLFLPHLEELVAFELKTTAIYDKFNIEQQLGAIQAVAASINGGNAAGIPLIVYRSVGTVVWNRPEGATRLEKWLVNIKADPDWVKATVKRLSIYAFTGKDPAALPADRPKQPRLSSGETPSDEQPREVVVDAPVPIDADDEEDATLEIPSLADVPEQVPGQDKTKPPLPPEPKGQGNNGRAQTELLRPYPPDVVKEKVLRAAEKYLAKGRQPSEAQIALLDVCLKQAVEDEAGRIVLVHWLTNGYPVDRLPGRYILALLRWMEPAQVAPGEYRIPAEAQVEAATILTTIAEEQGQGKLL